MPDELNAIAEKILSLADEIAKAKLEKENLTSSLKDLEKQYKKNKLSEQVYQSSVQKLTNGKSKEIAISESYIKLTNLVDELKRNNDLLIKNFSGIEKSIDIDKKVKLKRSELAYVKDLVTKRRERKDVIDVEYTLYESNKYGKIAMFFTKKFVINYIEKHPDTFKNLIYSLKLSGIKVLSNTYISMMFFYSFLASLLALVISYSIFSFISKIMIFNTVKSFTVAIIAGVAVFIIFYVYPPMLASSRKRKIKNDLPFAIIHMAAVAGSGAQPIAMFNLILNSEEYPGLSGEIKKVVNYVNLFGYDLTTALKIVSATTPSKDFKEMLEGLITTIASGGELKKYLDAKADDTMNSYELERKKYVETISTYSDIYTGVLIAAPLMFFITIAIIQIMGGAVMGLSAKTLALIGTFFVIPMLNIVFMIFLNIIQPEA